MLLHKPLLELINKSLRLILESVQNLRRKSEYQVQGHGLKNRINSK